MLARFTSGRLTLTTGRARETPAFTASRAQPVSSVKESVDLLFVRTEEELIKVPLLNGYLEVVIDLTKHDEKSGDFAFHQSPQAS